MAIVPCITCGKRVSSNAPQCPFCGAQTAAAAPPPVPPPVVPPPALPLSSGANQVLCPHCDEVLSADAVYCARCGRPTEAPAAAGLGVPRPRVVTCARCDIDGIEGDQYCRACGASLPAPSEAAAPSGQGQRIDQRKNPEPPPLPAVEPPPLPSLPPGAHPCINHPGREAVCSCSVCAETFCASCVDTPGPGATCHHCRERTTPAQPPPAVHADAAKLASEALTTAIIGIFCFGIVLGPVALSKANKAARLMDQIPGPVDGRGKVTAARIIGWLVIVVWVLGMIGRFAGNN